MAEPIAPPGVDRFVLADRLFDGHEVRPGVAVGLRGDRIAALVPGTDLPAGVPVDRLPGTTLTPGLIDAHVHMTPWMVYGLLAAGVTTVRDTGNDVDATVALLGALPPGPQPAVQWCGPLLESERVNWPTVARAHASTDEIRASVDELAGRGLRAIKLYANATSTLVAAASDQAHGHGMRVLCHLGATNFAEAVAGDVDELQHLAGCLAADIDETDWSVAAEVLAAAPVDHCPTLVVWQALARLGEPRAVRDAGMAWVPAHARDAWAAAYHATQPGAERLHRLAQLLERMSALVVLHRAGRRLLVGSDSPFPGLVPGVALHDEAGLMVAAGLGELDVLRAMTSGNAAAIGDDTVGVVAVGATADLVAFGGDPTVAIADLSRVARVWRAGLPVDQGRLAADAAEVFAQPPVSPVDLLARQRYVPATVTSG